MKNLIIKKIKILYSHEIIYPQYSLINQINAGLAGGDPDMFAWIDNKKSDIQDIEDELNSFDDEQIESLVSNFPKNETEENMLIYISNALDSADTDEKKMMCLLAIKSCKD
jgi:hypothetical protein